MAGTKKKRILILTYLILIFFLGSGAYQLYNNRKEQSRKEARFDRFMNYWYPVIEHSCYDMGIYTRMKKGIILDYIRNHTGRYIYEDVQLFDGGTFSMRQKSNIEHQLMSLTIGHMAAAPILSAPNSRLTEKNAFCEIFNNVSRLRNIDEYDEQYGYNSTLLYAIFDQIDSLAYEIQKNFIVLEKYKTTHYNDVNLNNIPYSEYLLKNY